MIYYVYIMFPTESLVAKAEAFGICKEEVLQAKNIGWCQQVYKEGFRGPEDNM